MASADLIIAMRQGSVIVPFSPRGRRWPEGPEEGALRTRAGRLDRAKRRRSTGVATELDVDNAQTEVAVLKLQLEAAKTGSK